MAQKNKNPFTLVEPQTIRVMVHRVKSSEEEDLGEAQPIYNVVATVIIDDEKDIGFSHHLFVATYDPIEACLMAFDGLTCVYGYDIIDPLFDLYDVETDKVTAEAYDIIEILEERGEIEAAYNELNEKKVTLH